MAGRVERIVIAPAAGADTIEPQSIEALAGRGLAGDRYLLSEAGGEAKGNVTLIERDAFDHLSGFAIELDESELRRNLVVTGIDLNPLVGREFRIGKVRCRTTELCEPCRYIEKRTAPGVLKALVGRGGIRAEILDSGTISIGDPVVALD
jgi:MOSC domain-containing protein YiiM